MFKSLNQRFKDFLETLKEVENIDNLPLNKNQKESKKADYFGANRELIIELKSLETDTEHKIEEILAPHRARPEFPAFFGGWEVRQVLKHLPDGEEINRQLFEAVTSSVQKIYREANKQIRNTKQTFNLPDSQGLLIILNEKIDVLSPEFIISKLIRTSKKKHPDQSYQFTEINFVLFLSQAHFSPQKNQTMAFPIVDLSIDNICEFRYREIVDFIVSEWTKFNGVPLLDGDKIKSLDELSLRSVAQYEKNIKTAITNGESQKRYYRRNPYFRSYDEAKMIWLYELIMSELMPGMLKDSNQKYQDGLPFWMEVFTHFLEEVDYRGLDFRIFEPNSQELGAKIRDDMNNEFLNL